MDTVNSFDVQRQIRNNTEDFHQCARDLKHWELDMKRKDRELSLQSKQKDIPPIRKKSKKEETKSSDVNKESRRISAYDYSSWDKFDADRVCEEMDKQDSDENSDTDVEEEDIDRIAAAVYNKEQGNKLVKQEKWGEAIEQYNLAIQTYPNDSVFYANRALCFLKMKNFISAEADCTSSLRLDNTYVKAYQRRAAARQSLNQFQEARNDVLKILQLEPNNKQAEIDLANLNRKLNLSQYNSHQNNISKSTSSKTSPISSSENKKIKEISNTSKKVQFNATKNCNTNVQDVSWVPPYDTAKYSPVQSVQKPAHQRSKKPLMKISIKPSHSAVSNNITNVIEEKTRNIVISDESEETAKCLMNKDEIMDKDKETNNEADKKKRLEVLESAWKELQASNPYKKSENFKIVNKQSESFNDISKVPSQSTDLKIPSPPKTCSQFELHWRTLKFSKENLFLYLKQINGSELPNIFQDGLESTTFIDIVTCLSNQFMERNENVGTYLLGLSNMRRLNFLVMFMTNSEKLLLSKLVTYCQNRTELSADQIEELKRKFQL